MLYAESRQMQGHQCQRIVTININHLVINVIRLQNRVNKRRALDKEAFLLYLCIIKSKRLRT